MYLIGWCYQLRQLAIANAVIKQEKIDSDVYLDDILLDKKQKEYVTVVDVFEMTITVKKALELSGYKIY